MKKSIIAALIGASALISAWGTASAATYNLWGWYQRSSGGALSSLLFKAGTSQGCPNFAGGFIQPCYDDAIPNDSGQNQWQIDNDIIARVIAAGPPGWDWDGTTLTVTGMFWATSAIGSNPNATQVISDRYNFNGGSYGGTFTITPGTSTTTNPGSYECIEGVFLKTVGANGCLNVNTAGSNIAAVSTVTYNIGGVANCIDRTVIPPDTDTGPPRAVFTAAAAGACDAVDGGLTQYIKIRDTGGVLILATNGTAGVLTSIGPCLFWGPASHGASLGGQEGRPCPVDVTLADKSYFVLITPAAQATDGDGDGMADGLDNCTTLANPDQYDGDGDGYGNRCDGDFNNNNATNAQDYAFFRTKLASSPADPEADINHNGAVNAQDYGIFRTLLASPPGPSALH